LTFILVSAVTALLLAGCGGGPAPEPPAQGQQAQTGTEPAPVEKQNQVNQGSAGQRSAEKPQSPASKDRPDSKSSPRPGLIEPLPNSNGLPPVSPGMAFAVGKKIPPFTLADLDGKKHSGELFSARRLTVLDFWGTY
jgi:hypothetical protein